MSIFKKMSILFITSLILMIVIGSWIDTINSKRIDNLIKEKYIKITDEILKNFDNKNYLDQLFIQQKLKVLDNNFTISAQILHHQKNTFSEITILKGSFSDELIIKIKYLDEEYILKTQDEKNLTDKMILNTLIFLDIFVLVLIFLYILKLLSPLKTISKQMTNFSNGDLSSRINIKSKDEIGILSNSFNKMAENLQNLIKTREELLRDIGHELRSPIAKGKFAIEKIDDFSQKKLLKKIFNDLETLTNELIELEKLNSTKLNITSFDCETLIVESLGKLYLDDESKINIKIDENFKINADLHYLTKVLKNLIDNALKYTSSYPINIISKTNTIEVSNKGKKLSKGLEYYLKPFTQELSQRDGFGLGLSIVKKVLDKHNFKLEYEFKNQTNIFKIIFA